VAPDAQQFRAVPGNRDNTESTLQLLGASANGGTAPLCPGIEKHYLGKTAKSAVLDLLQCR
ncbi:hypothetical protein N1E93_28925, partial [Pseudomonas aeruginosa]|nr:hypothetical protein [Pseudomonas aeruginosa]